MRFLEAFYYGVFILCFLGTNCILGDEYVDVWMLMFFLFNVYHRMGLGKTLQTLSLFAYIAETSQGARPIDS